MQDLVLIRLTVACWCLKFFSGLNPAENALCISIQSEQGVWLAASLLTITKAIKFISYM